MEQTQAQPNLSLADITLALQIIQVAASRGVFKPEEYAEIGGCYDRIFGFLEASGAIKRTDEAPQTDEGSVAESVAAPETDAPAAPKKAATKSKGKK